jgi:hypothetical protein
MGATRGASSRSTFSFAEGFETFVLLVSSATTTTTVTSTRMQTPPFAQASFLPLEVHKDFVP